MLKMSEFQFCGVWPICPEMPATFSLTLSKRPVRLEIIPPASISFIHSVSEFLSSSMRRHLLPRGARILPPSAEWPGEQRYERHADERHAAAGHELFYP